MYRSTDGGKTWKHLGLGDGEQIVSIIVDPRDPARLFVAVLGHPYGPNIVRGVFRSTDAGESFQKVLYRDENTGAAALSFDPADSRTVYASLWSARQAPWENGQWEGPGSGMYKSTDGGSTWRRLTEGLPTYEQGLGRIGFCVAPSRPDAHIRSSLRKDRIGRVVSDRTMRVSTGAGSTGTDASGDGATISPR